MVIDIQEVRDRTLQRITPYITLIRLGAEICVWCGKLQNNIFPAYLSNISEADVIWIPELPKKASICISPCKLSLRNLIISLALHELDKIQRGMKSA